MKVSLWYTITLVESFQASLRTAFSASAGGFQDYAFGYVRSGAHLLTGLASCLRYHCPQVFVIKIIYKYNTL
jgi:hypothetical protein